MLGLERVVEEGTNWWVSMAALGSPVEPLVYWRLHTSWVFTSFLAASNLVPEV